MLRTNELESGIIRRSLANSPMLKRNNSEGGIVSQKRKEKHHHHHHSDDESFDHSHHSDELPRAARKRIKEIDEVKKYR